jgi:hypothetical protein
MARIHGHPQKVGVVLKVYWLTELFGELKQE